MTSADKSAYRNALRDWRVFLATGGGVGLTPKIPGTIGTIIAYPLYVLAAMFLPAAAVWTLAAALCVGGVYLCGYAGRRLQRHDDQAIVWDEIAAFFLLLCALPEVWQWQLAGFILFRIFDGWKPFPINYLDRRIGGGVGVMLDDIAAAALTWFILVTLFIFFP